MSVQGQRRKILIVDDSEVCLDLARLALEERGHEVVTLTTPLGFSSMLSRERPDLALVDVLMPALQGHQLIEIAKRYALPHCPLVLFTSRPEKELAALASSCGAAGYIVKTSDWEAFVRAVETYLDRAGRGATEVPPRPLARCRSG